MLVVEASLEVGPMGHDLSPREREVLALVGEGLCSKEIARRLAISARTVDVYVLRARVKLGAVNRASAALVLDRSVRTIAN